MCLLLLLLLLLLLSIAVNKAVDLGHWSDMNKVVARIEADRRKR